TVLLISALERLNRNRYFLEIRYKSGKWVLKSRNSTSCVVTIVLQGLKSGLMYWKCAKSNLFLYKIQGISIASRIKEDENRYLTKEAPGISLSSRLRFSVLAAPKCNSKFLEFLDNAV